MQASLPETKKIESMPASMLVSATYDNISKSAVLKFYEPESKNYFMERRGRAQAILLFKAGIR